VNKLVDTDAITGERFAEWRQALRQNDSTHLLRPAILSTVEAPLGRGTVDLAPISLSAPEFRLRTICSHHWA
jgi:hypothetical protein